MKNIKQTAFTTLIGAELIFVALFYVCGSSGVQALKKADRINGKLLQEVKQLEHDIALLTKELHDRLENPFYKESVARKDLQMAYKDETVYLLPDKG